MSDYNLDENPVEYFEFTLGGNQYKMRYPNTEEIQAAQKIKDDKEKTQWVYTFIEPESKDAPTIQEALAKVNIKVLQKFNKMIETEFSQET